MERTFDEVFAENIGTANHFTRFVARYPRYICIAFLIFELLFVAGLLISGLLSPLPDDSQRDFYDFDHIGTKMSDM